MFQKRTPGSGPRGKGPGGGGRFGDKKKDSRFGDRQGTGRFFQKKTCRFCAERSELLDYKDSEKLKRFLTEKGKITPRRITGNCAKHQRVLSRAIKRARHAAFIAFQID